MTTKPIDEGFLPPLEPAAEEYSQSTHADLLDDYESEQMTEFLETEQPLLELELLLRTDIPFAILTRGTGGGKSLAVLLYLLNETRKNGTHALIIVPSRAAGEELQKKCLRYLALLGDTRRCVTYYGGKDEEQKRANREIREAVAHGNDHIAVIIMTLYAYAGSLTHHSPMGTAEEDDAEQSKYLTQLASPVDWGHVLFGTDEEAASMQMSWYQKLANPAYLFIDEIDSFPLPAIYCLAMLARVLYWRGFEQQDIETRVILASATVGNPEVVADLFFGSDVEYLNLGGTGRRGPTTVRVYLEEVPETVFWERVKAIQTYVRDQRRKIKPGTIYIPPKVILFINHKRKIDINRIVGLFPTHFVTVHGDMPSKTLAKRLKNFREKRSRICLVATNIAQAAMHVPEAFWVVSYGLPTDPRAYLQRRARVGRDPRQSAQLEIILRATHTFERDLADPNNRTDLKAFIYRENPPPLKLPRCPFLGLQYGMVLGLMLGLWDIRARLQTAFQTEADPFFSQDMHDAYLGLLLDGVVMVGPPEKIRPTPKTKQWMYAFPKQFGSDSFEVILLKPRGVQKPLGTISLLNLLRYGLPSQTIPYIDDNYEVVRIDIRQKKVFVKKNLQPLEYFHNQVISTYVIRRLLAHHSEKDIALVTVFQADQVTEVDADTAAFEPSFSLRDLAVEHHLTGIFLPKKMTLPVVNQVRRLFTQLEIENTLFQQEAYSHENLGPGTLLIDTTNLGLAGMFYDRWTTEAEGT